MARILILEDDQELAVYWRQAMSPHHVDISLTSSEAIAFETNDEFDLFIVDLMIGNHDEPIRDTGQNFLIHLAKRHSEQFVERRVIGVSGFMAQRDPNFATMIFSSHSVHDMLKKPFAPSDLVVVVERKLGALQQAET